MFEQYIANDYLRSFILFVCLLLLFRIVLTIIQRVALALTSKTKTDLDDKLVDKTSKPLTIFAGLVSLVFAFREMNLQENLLRVLDNVVYSSMVVILAYIAFVVVNLLIVNGLKHLAKKTKSNIDNTLIALVNSVLNAALIIFSLIYILSLWGIEVGPLLAGLGVAGIAVALALQPILSNIFSGASVILDQSVRAGDVVYIDEVTGGTVQKVGLRSTQILTFDNEFIIVPNNTLAQSNIQNIYLPEKKQRIVLPFGVAYGSDIEKVKKIVLAEVKKIKGFVKDTEPKVRFLEMADSSLNFKAYFYVEDFDIKFDAIDEANTRIYNALNKAKIEIPFPQMDVHLKK